MLTCLRPECQSDRLKVTQAITPLTGGNLGMVIDPLEPIVQEQPDQPRNFNELLLLLGDVPHGLVKRPPEQVPELLLVGVIDPALLHTRNPEHSLETPERYTERTNSSVLPVADARDTARLRVHVDIIL